MDKKSENSAQMKPMFESLMRAGKSMRAHSHRNTSPFRFCGSTYRSVLFSIPACDEAILPLHLLHLVFVDLLGVETHRSAVGVKHTKLSDCIQLQSDIYMHSPWIMNFKIIWGL